MIFFLFFTIAGSLVYADGDFISPAAVFYFDWHFVALRFVNDCVARFDWLLYPLFHTRSVLSILLLYFIYIRS